MDVQWHQVWTGALTVFVITTLYSYLICGLVGLLTGIRTRGDKAAIDQALEKFIVSPFYVATLFSLLSVLYYWRGVLLKVSENEAPLLSMGIMGALVFVGHMLLEVLESTLTKRNPLRILDDRDALKLSGIYLIVLVIVTSVAALT